MESKNLKWFRLHSVYVLIAALVISGCATRGGLDKYPRREIDRPYTLPKKVKSWSISEKVGIGSDRNSGPFFTAQFPGLLKWDQSLSDNVNLLWSPLPAGFSFQLLNDDINRIGLSLALANFGGFDLTFHGVMVDQVTGVNYQPQISFSYRRKFSQDIALDITPSFKMLVPLSSSPPVGGPYSIQWTARVLMGPLFQLSDTFALSPGLSVGVFRGAQTIANNTVQTSLVADLVLSTIWSIAREWDFRSTYAYKNFGYSNGYQGHSFFVEFVRFW